MRVVWLSPGLRPLARKYVEGLLEIGVDCMLVTADIHPESAGKKSYETVLLGRPVPTSDWKPILETYRKMKQFQPDIVVTEFLRDPRWRILASLAPRVRLLHDAAPHDDTHIAPWWNRLFFDRWDARADATVVFSEYVASFLEAPNNSGRLRAYVAPLISDLPTELRPALVPADLRRDVVLVGRQRPYKNHKVIFEAWEAHTRGNAWPGDELVLIGSGEIQAQLPRHSRWIKSAYKYADVIERISHARASIVHSRNASQSGVQLLSLQLGVPTVVSTQGGLAEYQPPGLDPIAVDDVGGLARTFDKLANRSELAKHCAIAVDHYDTYYDSSIAALRLREIFEAIIANR